MTKRITLALPILASIVTLMAGLHTDRVSLTEFAGLHTVSAQNATNMTAGTNMTNATSGGNATSSNTSTSTAKMHLEEGLKALKAGDKDSAMTHLSAAQAAMSGASSNAMMHFQEGMKALQAGDTNGAITHLTAADQSLG